MQSMKMYKGQFEKYSGKVVWETMTKDRVIVSNMEPDHLFNSIAMIVNNLSEHLGYEPTKVNFKKYDQKKMIGRCDNYITVAAYMLWELECKGFDKVNPISWTSLVKVRDILLSKKIRKIWRGRNIIFPQKLSFNSLFRKEFNSMMDDHFHMENGLDLEDDRDSVFKTYEGWNENI